MRKNHRSKALRESARDEPCVVCGMVGSTVWAHSNEIEHGKGMGIKAHDLLGLYLCHKCHEAYDQRLDRGQRKKYFREYYPATMVRVAEKIAEGVLVL